MLELIQKWAEPDSNRRPFGYQPNAPAKLSYRPITGATDFTVRWFITVLINLFNLLITFDNYSGGPVAQHGLRCRPSEPEIEGSNPSGPAINSSTEKSLQMPLQMAFLLV